jgi:hypothetical protein
MKKEKTGKAVKTKHTKWGKDNKKKLKHKKVKSGK